MNTRITLSAALAVGAFLVLVPAQAQAPGNQKSQVKIEAMQSQINALQTQVKQLQQQLIQARQQAGLPNPGVSPFYRVPNSPLPNLTLPNITLPNVPGITVVPVVPPTPRYYSIPDYTATFIKRTAR